THCVFFFFSSRRRHTRFSRDWSSDVCSSDLDDRYNAQFYARADNLRFWLSTVEGRLGSLSQRLTASVGQRRLNIDLAGETGGKQSAAAPAGEMIVKTPWHELDDASYEARGTTRALGH